MARLPIRAGDGVLSQALYRVKILAEARVMDPRFLLDISSAAAAVLLRDESAKGGAPPRLGG